MPEFIEQLKPFFKEDVKIEDITELLKEYSEELKKGINPLAGITTENAWEVMNKHQPLKSTFDKKVTESIETWKSNNFDKMYEERYNKEHPPADEKDEKLRELESKINEANKKFEEQQRKTERERVRNIATAKTIELLGKEAIKIIDLIDGETEDIVISKLTLLAEYINGIKKTATEDILKNYSVNPGTGGGEPETNRENYIKQYNEAQSRGDAITMLSLLPKIKKK